MSITIIGIGGASTKILSSLKQEKQNNKNRYIGFDSDKNIKALELDDYCMANEELFEGSGCFMDIFKGNLAIANSSKKIEEMLSDSQQILVLACLGGGIGSGALAHITDYLAISRKRYLVLVTTPADFEGLKRAKNAKESLDAIKYRTDNMLTFSMEDLNSKTDLGIKELFLAMDKKIEKCILELANGEFFK